MTMRFSLLDLENLLFCDGVPGGTPPGVES